MKLAGRAGEKKRRKRRREKELSDNQRKQKRKYVAFVSGCLQIHIHYPEAPGLRPAGREGTGLVAVTQRRASQVGEEEEQAAG